MKLRLTVVTEYEANPVHYGTDDPVKAAGIDLEGFKEDPVSIAALIEEHPLSTTITVAPA